MAGRDDVCVLIPTYDEAATIGEVVAGFREQGFDEVLVIDGHSTDGTRAIAREHGARVVEQSGRGRGRGKGQAVREGIDLVERPYVLMVDGDGTYRPEDAGRLLEPLLEGAAEHVIGDRYADMDAGAMTRFIGWFIGQWLSTLRCSQTLLPQRCSPVGIANGNPVCLRSAVNCSPASGSFSTPVPSARAPSRSAKRPSNRAVAPSMSLRSTAGNTTHNCSRSSILAKQSEGRTRSRRRHVFVSKANTLNMAFQRGEDLDQATVNDRVDTAIEDNEVVLFMKGNELMPQCGYSDRALGLIGQYREEFATVDVLESLDEYRVALERHSGWETTPQTFVDGEFVGGSDVLAELDERGDLETTLATG